MRVKLTLYACTSLHLFFRRLVRRVGQNPIHTVYIRYFWQGNHQIYSHIRCICIRSGKPYLYVIRQSCSTRETGKVVVPEKQVCFNMSMHYAGGCGASTLAHTRHGHVSEKQRWQNVDGLCKVRCFMQDWTTSYSLPVLAVRLCVCG
jgi:hypothetical protein